MSKKRNKYKQLRSAFRLKTKLTNAYSKGRKRLLVFLVFVLFASLFWFYRALDDTYVEDIKYPVRFINLPTNKILTSIPPKKIVLRVRGDGYSILSKKFKAPPLTFDVNNFSLKNQSLDSLSVYLITRMTQESLSQQLISENEQLEIISISPDTIFFNFSKTRNKKIAIRPVFEDPLKLYAQQHTHSGKFIIKPDSIVLVGPVNIVDSVKHLYTKPIALFELKDTVSISSEIIQIPGTKASTEYVNLTIPVEKFTELSFELPLQVKQVPDSLSLKVFPQNVKVIYNITRSRIKDISQSDFRPYVDYSDITNLEDISNSKLNVQLDSIPEYSFSISIYPSQVEFLIENNAEDWNNRGDR